MVQKFEKQSLRILWLNTRHPVLKHFRDLFFCTTVGGPNFPAANSMKLPFYKSSNPPPPTLPPSFFECLYFHFNLKGFCFWYACSCSLCREGNSFCMRLLIFWKLWRFIFIFSNGFTSCGVLPFSLYWSLSSTLCMVFDAISLNAFSLILSSVNQPICYCICLWSF